VKTTESPFDFFTREESDRVIAAARTPGERAILLFAFHSGATAGEQLAFEWQDLDLHNKLLVFRRSATHGIVGPTKGGKERKVPLTATLEAALRSIRHCRGPDRRCYTHRASARSAPRPRERGRTPPSPSRQRRNATGGRVEPVAVDLVADFPDAVPQPAASDRVRAGPNHRRASE
jgi:integrase